MFLAIVAIITYAVFSCILYFCLVKFLEKKNIQEMLFLDGFKSQIKHDILNLGADVDEIEFQGN